MVQVQTSNCDSNCDENTCTGTELLHFHSKYSMDKIRNRVDIKQITNEKEAKKLISKPNFNHRTILTENLIAVHKIMKKTKVYYNRPIYLGLCILDFSKTLMYETSEIDPDIAETA